MSKERKEDYAKTAIQAAVAVPADFVQHAANKQAAVAPGAVKGAAVLKAFRFGLVTAPLAAHSIATADDPTKQALVEAIKIGIVSIGFAAFNVAGAFVGAFVGEVFNEEIEGIAGTIADAFRDVLDASTDLAGTVSTIADTVARAIEEELNGGSDIKSIDDLKSANEERDTAYGVGYTKASYNAVLDLKQGRVSNNAKDPVTDGGAGKPGGPTTTPDNDNDNDPSRDRTKPIAIDLNNDGKVDLIDKDDSSIFFDIDNNGYRENVGWVGADDGFLVIDKDGDGNIVGDELVIADQTEAEDTDLEAVATLYDTNNDGVLDKLDQEFSKFKIWQDLDQDGEVDDGELKSLDEWGIKSVDLSIDKQTSNIDNNLVLGTSTYTKDDGTNALVADIAIEVSNAGFRIEENSQRLTIKHSNGATYYYAKEGNAIHATASDLGVQAVYGHNQDDELSAGSSLNVVLSGGGGDDTLTGSRGSDWLTGDAGADKLSGGAGHDVLFFDAADTLVDGGEGYDVALVSDGIGASLDLSASGIETAVGNAGADRFTYTGENSVSVYGNQGDDELITGAGNDVLEGGSGSDVLSSGAGNDVIFIDAEDKQANIDAGAGEDWVRVSSVNGVNIDLAAINAENIIGNAGADVIRNNNDVDIFAFGADGDDDITGGSGDDIIEGGAGADTLNGADGIDYVSYATSTSSVSVNLETNVVSGEDADGDTISNFEGIIATNRGDTLTGNSSNNAIFGNGGADFIQGGVGADYLDGGDGSDTSSYVGSNASVQIDLAAQTATGGHAEGDRLFNIENLTGSFHNDTLAGDDNDNIIEGGGGADTLKGGKGIDTLSYSLSSSGVTVDLEANTASGGDAEGDIYDGFENAIGSAHADSLSAKQDGSSLEGYAGDDTLTGRDGDDILEGGAGADTLDGGAGIDDLSYETSTEGVTVNLATGVVSGGDAEGDVISNFENIQGSYHDDTLTGDDNDNVIEGDLGGDTIDGGLGIDTASYIDGVYGVDVDLKRGGGRQHDQLGTKIDSARLSGSVVIDGLNNKRSLHQGTELSTAYTLATIAAASGWATTALALDQGTDVDAEMGALLSVQHDLGAGEVRPQDMAYLDVSFDGDTAIIRYHRADGSLEGQFTVKIADSTTHKVAFGYDKVTGLTVVSIDGQVVNSYNWAEGLDVMAGSYGSRGAMAAHEEADGRFVYSLGLLTDEAVNDTLTNIENLKGSIFGDRLAGDDGDNVIEGNGGNDDLKGYAGNDTLDGGTGSDVLSGGDGNDTLRGGDNSDSLYGDAGDDILDGGRGHDLLEGGEGIDSLSGGDGNDLLKGEQGNDTLHGDLGNDQLYGGDGNDTLHGDTNGVLFTRDADGNQIGGFGDVSFQGGSSLRKVSGGDVWDAGVYSAESFTGSGELSFEVTETTSRRIVGLSSAAGDSNHSSIEFAFYPYSDGRLFIYESGTQIGEFGSYASGDILSIERTDTGAVVYKKNGENVYTSTKTSSPDTPLLVDSSFKTVGATIGEVTLSVGGADAEQVSWITDSNTEVGKLGSNLSVDYQDLNADGYVDAVINSADGQIWTRLGDGSGNFGEVTAQHIGTEGLLRKVSGGDSWDAGAYSAESFTGSGELSFEVTETTSRRVVGLSSSAGDSGHSSIEFAFYPYSSGRLFIYESGTQIGEFGSYVSGDILSIERTDTGAVIYKKNGETVYTSTKTSSPDTPLLVDSSFKTVGATIGEVTLSVGGADAEQVSWITGNNIELTSLGSDLTVDYQDLNADGHVDAVISSTGGQIWTRLGDGSGNFGKAVEQSTGAAGLVKISNTNWDGGAYSSESFTGSGGMSVVATETTTDRLIGLSSSAGNSSYTSIEYALYQTVSGVIYIFESGVSRGAFSSYSTGDVLGIERSDTGVITYTQNGVVFYASTVSSDPNIPLLVDTALSSLGATIGEVKIHGGSNASPEQVTWITDQNLKSVPLGSDLSIDYQDLNNDGHVDAVISSTGGQIWTRLGDGAGNFGEVVEQNTGSSGLKKISGGASWTNAGAHSAESFTGSGLFSVVATETNTDRMIGLATSAGNSSYHTIDYALYLTAAGNIAIYESANLAGTFGTYETGDILSVERTDSGNIVYSKNGVIIYTSSNTTPVTTPLLVDTSFELVGTTLGEVTLTTGGETHPVTWIADENVEVGGLGSDLSIDYQDLNNDGHVDAVISSTGGQIWTRLGDGAGNFGEVVEQNTGSSGLKKISGGASWTNAGAHSAESFTGSGLFSVVATETNTDRMIGLATSAGNSSYHTIDYALYLTAAGNIAIYESANLAGTFGTYETGDILSVERTDSGNIVYSKNGVIIYTSSNTTPVTTPLLVDTSFELVGTTLGEVTLTTGGETHPVTWIADENVEVGGLGSDLSIDYQDLNNDGHVDAVISSTGGQIWTRLGDGAGNFGEVVEQNTGSSGLKKISGGASWTNAGAHSAESFTGSGLFSVVATETNTDRMIGLATSAGNSSYHTIDYALYLTAAGNIAIYESANLAGTFGTYETGDILSVERTDSGNIVYSKNGVIIYTSSNTTPVTTPLLVDTSFELVGTTLGEVTLTTGGETHPVTWIADENVEVGGLGSDLSIDYQDLNNDGHVDAVISSTGGQIWTRLGDGSGNFGDAVEQDNGTSGRELGSNLSIKYLDLNGDGVTDALINSEDGRIWTRLGNGVGDDKLDGGAGDDLLYGDVGKDTLTGGEGNDTLYGGSGADDLSGGKGDDLLIGGDSDGDVYRFNVGDGADTIRNNGAHAKLVFGTGIALADIEYSKQGSDLLLRISATDVVTIEGWYLDSKKQVAIALDDEVGRALVLGDSSANDLTGTSGDDILNGLGGNDTLTGGAGDDIYIFDRGHGESTIHDQASVSGTAINSGYDSIVFESGIIAADVITVLSGNNLIVALKDPNNPAATLAELTDKITITNWLDSNQRIEALTFADGTDMAVFTGNRSDYLIEDNGDGSFTVIGGADGRDVVTDIETLRFADGDFDLTTVNGPEAVDAKVVYDGSGPVSHKLSFADADLDVADSTEVLSFKVVDATDNGDNSFTLQSGALVTINADGTYSYDPQGYTGQDSFTWRVTDSTGLSKDATVAVSRTGDNGPNFTVLDTQNAAPNDVISADGRQLGSASWDGSELTYATNAIEGKVYWEVKVLVAGGFSASGVAQKGSSPFVNVVGDATGWGWYSGEKFHDNVRSSYGPAGDSVGDVIMYAVDKNTGEMWIGKNGNWLEGGDPSTNTAPMFDNLSGEIFPAFTAGNSETPSMEVNFGQEAYAYTPPADFGNVGIVYPDIIGTAGNDILHGDENSTVLKGQAGDDLLKGGTGDDTIDGGYGNDVAVFTSNRSDYLIEDNGDGSFTVIGGADGRDVVTDIETLRFADGDFDLTTVNGPEAVDAKVVYDGSGPVSHKLSFADADLDVADSTEVLSFKVVDATDNGDNSFTLQSGALVTINADGTYSYDPQGYTGQDSFTWRVTDSTGLSKDATVAVSRTGDNGPNFTVLDTQNAAPNDVISADGRQLGSASWDGSELTYATNAIEGKVYWEVKVLVAGGFSASGVAQKGSSPFVNVVGDATGWGWYSGEKFHDNVRSSYGPAGDSVGDVIMYAVDKNTGEMWIGKNGNWLEGGDPSTNTAPMFDNLSGEIFPAFTAGNSETPSMEVNFGQEAYAYTPPADFGNVGIVYPDIIGTAGNDILHGDENSTVLKGQAGDDLLKGGTGDDTIDGGYGNDVAVFTSNRSDYLIEDNGDGSFTVIGGADGRDVVTDIETLRFADGDFDLTTVNGPEAVDAKVVYDGSGPVSHKLSFADADLDVADSTEVLSFKVVDATDNGDNSFTLQSGALVTINADGTYSYDPQGYTGQDSFTWRVTDSTGLSKDATVAVSRTGDNGPNFTVLDTQNAAPNDVISADGRQLGSASWDGSELTYATNAIEGKVYWEVKVLVAGGFSASGVAQKGSSPFVNVVGDATGWGWYSGEKFHDNVRSSYGPAGDSVGDVIMYAVDKNTGEMWIGKNGNWLEGGDPSTNTAPMFDNLSGEIFPAFTAGNSETPSMEVNFGQEAYAYTPPADFGNVGIVYPDIIGTAGNDILHGDENSTVLKGQAGDDLLKGGTGDDTIDGGYGNDVAVFTSNRSDYLIEDNGDGSFTVIGGADGRDVVTDIETLRFADGDFDLTTVSGPEAVDAKIVFDGSGPVSHKLSFADADLDVADSTEVLSFKVVDATDNGDNSFTLQSGALVTINTDGTYSYDPQGYIGQDSFTWRVTDSTGLSKDATVAVSMPTTETGSAGEFNGTNGYLQHTPGSHGDGQTWTFSAWVKRGELGGLQEIFQAGTIADVGNFHIIFDESNRLRVMEGSTTKVALITNQTFESTDDYYHIVFAYDSTQDQATDRARIYVNGQQVTEFAQSPWPTAYPAQNSELLVNNGYQQQIGAAAPNNSYGWYYNGAIDNVRMIDGTAHEPGMFGREDPNAPSAWIASEPIGLDYGTTGYFLADPSTGQDLSGNGNHFSVNGGVTSTDGVSVDIAVELSQGTSGHDVLMGGDTNDVINGNAGDDLISGGVGDDILEGGTGNDTYLFNIGDGQDLIRNNGLEDKVIFGTGITQNDLTFVKDGNNLIINVSETDQLTIENWFVSFENRVAFEGSDGVVMSVVLGNNSDNNLSGTSSQDTVIGFAGNDILNGNDGKDTLDGGLGNDQLFGGAGNDSLRGDTKGMLFSRDEYGDAIGGFGSQEFQGDSSLSKVSGGNAWNSGAYSKERFTGAGVLTIEVTEASTNRVIGLSSSYGDSNFRSSEFALNPGSDGNLYVYESGTYLADLGAYSVGDILSIERSDSGVVTYSNNGVVLYTSTKVSSPETSLLVDAYLYHTGAELGDVTLSVNGLAAERVSWITDSNVELGTLGSDLSVAYQDLNGDGHVDALINSTDGQIWTRLGDGTGNFGDTVEQKIVSSNQLSKVSGGNAWNSGAYSKERFTGAGVLTIEVTEASTNRVIGLSSSYGDSNFRSSEFALNPGSDGNLYVYESGTYLADLGAYSVGDILSIERSDSGVVTYSNNGVVLYTSTKVSSPETSLLVDAYLYHTGAELGDVTLSVNGLAAERVSWITDSNVELGTLGSDLSVAYQDLNGDGHVDALINSTDGQIWTRLGDGTGNFGEAVAHNTGSDTGPLGSDLTVAYQDLNGDGHVDGLISSGDGQIWTRLGDGTGNFGDASAHGNGNIIAFQNIKKISGNGGFDAGAHSVETITGEGALSFVATETTTYRMIGLTSNVEGSGYTNIQYAFYMHGHGYLDVWESGVHRGNVGGRYNPGDELSIIRTASGAIQYLKNGSIVYTSPTLSPLDQELQVDTSIHDIGGTIEQVAISDNPNEIIPVTWIADDSVEVTETPTSIELASPDENLSVAYQDLNGDGHVDALINSTDGQIWTRLGDGTGNFGEAVAHNTGSDTGPLGSDLTVAYQDLNGDGHVDGLISSGDGQIWTRLGDGTGNFGDASAHGNGNIIAFQNIKKISGNGGFDAGAHSVETITGEGALSFVATETTTYRMIGLTSNVEGSGYTNIQYAFYMHGHGYLDVWESGVHRGNVGGRYNPGDELSIIRTASGAIQYLKNGSIVYTSPTLSPLDQELQVDTSIHDIGGTIEQVAISDNPNEIIPVTWIADDSVEVTETPTSIELASPDENLSVAYQDLNGDGHVDALINSTDGQIWTRLGDGTGNFGEAVAHNTGSDTGPLGSDLTVAYQDLNGDGVLDAVISSSSGQIWTRFANGAGDDILSGGAGNDVLDGDVGQDVLKGEEGNDSLIGGVGNDILEGGAGNDSFIFKENLGHDTITDFVSGAGSEDSIRIEGLNISTFDAVLQLAEQVGDDTVINIDDDNSITLKDVQKTALHADDFQFV